MEVSVAVALCLIFAAALSFEIKVSSAVLEIVAGMILAIFIVDIESVTWLQFLSNLGMMALMFVAGFELRIKRLKQTWVPCVSIGLVSFILPFIGIFSLCLFWLGIDIKAAALVGIGLSTTSLALVYHLLKERDLLESHEGQIMFGAASVVDIISMIALAILLGEWGSGTALFAFILTVSVIALPRFGGWIFRHYSTSIAELELRFLMAVIIGMGFMAEEIGHVHPALVAFTLGVFMSRVVEHHKAVKDKLMALVFGFFAPLFFLHAGTRIDFSDFKVEYLLAAAVMFVAATGLKYIGTRFPAKYFIKDRAHYSGVLFNYRLSFGIITANVGLETGIISHQMFSVIMIVVVASAVIPSIFLREKGILMPVDVSDPHE